MAKKKLVVMDGNTAAAYASYAFTEVAAIFPITPSSVMAEKVDEWSAKGRTNIFGKPVEVIEMQSEAGAAGTCHGSLQAGALTTTTRPLRPAADDPAYVQDRRRVPARRVPHLLPDCQCPRPVHLRRPLRRDDLPNDRLRYADVLLPQEAMDLGAVAHLSAIGGRYAFMHCFDGFRTSHEMQRIEALDYEDLRPLVDQEALQEFRRHA